MNCLEVSLTVLKCDIGSWVIDESSPAYYFSRDFHSQRVILDDESKWTWEKSGKLPPVYFPFSCEKYIHSCSKGVLSCSKKESLLLHAFYAYFKVDFIFQKANLKDDINPMVLT